MEIEGKPAEAEDRHGDRGASGWSEMENFEANFSTENDCGSQIF